MNDTPDDEPLLDGLEELPPGAWDLPAGDGGLRQRLLAETSTVVRSRGRRRRVRRYAGFALAYAAGIATAAIVWQGRSTVPPSPPAVRIIEVTTDDNPVHVAAARADEAAEAAPTARSLPTDDPVALRRQVAAAPPAEQIELLRRAGDLYLNRYDDLESALDCYRQVLELTPPAERGRFDAGDSWLLAELKHAQVATAVAAADAQ